MDRWYVAEMRARLAGRSKRDLIEAMIERSPHQSATDNLVAALDVYPLLLLLLACDLPTRVWLLDEGERPSSAAILNDHARGKRWHSRGIGVDECEGLTEVVDGRVVIVASWRALLAMRHEFAHAVTTFFSPQTRQGLESLYVQARRRNAFVEPLARESVGEYVACGLSYRFFPDLSGELSSTDWALHRYLEGLVRQAERVSALIAAPSGRRGHGPEGESAASDRMARRGAASAVCETIGPSPSLRRGSDVLRRSVGGSRLSQTTVTRGLNRPGRV